MAFSENVSGTWKALSLWGNVSGTWKKISLWQNVSGTWKKLSYTDIALSGDTEASGSCDVNIVPGSCTATASVTLTCSGGNIPTFSWSYISGTTGLSTSGDGTLTFNVSKSLECDSVGPGDSASAVYRCTAHDGVGPDATWDVTFDLTSEGLND